jgi:YD repeat-containing protein
MTKKKQYISLLIVLTIIGLKLTAQSNCPNHENIIELDHNCNIVVENYEARERISLKPEFSFNASNGRFSARLNETLVLDLEYTDEIYVPDIEEVQIDTELAVGSIAGMHGVSPTGAATYTVPIGVPGGVAGLEPNISINYNSQSGSGLLGWGWHLAGTSAIVRVPQTEYYDGNITAIQLNNDDRFMLDGLRLLPKNGGYAGYGTNNFEYEKEITDFSNIKSIGAGNNMHFIVTTKDGIIIEYGVTEDSRLFTSGDNILAWNINKITDRNGNYITFTYDNSDEECVISYIEYTGNTNAGQEPTNKITFVYDKRSVDKNQMYISNGEFIKTEKILTKIIVRSNNSVLSKYEFNYFHDNIHTKLWEIKQYGINDEEINSTIVNWGEKGDLLSRNSMFPSNGGILNASEYSQFLIADFTGNGRSDIIYHDFIFNEYNMPTDKTFDLYGTLHFSAVTGSYIDYNEIASSTINLNYSIGGRYSSNLNIAKSNYYIISDFSGDMKNDLLIFEKQLHHDNSNYEYQHNFKIYSKINNSFSEIQDFNFTNRTGITYDDLVTRKNDNDMIYGDFTGDGTTNFLVFFFDYEEFAPANCPYIHAFKPMLCCPATGSYYSIIGAQSDICQFAQSLVPAAGGLNKIFSIDFTGDGKDEIIVLNDIMAMIFKIDILNNNTFQIVNIHNTYSLNRNNEIHGFGDFNGDGKTDFLFDNGRIAYSTGSSFTIFNPVSNFQSNYKDPQFLIGDFNGDGKSDFMVIYVIVSLQSENTSGNQTMCLYNVTIKMDVYTSRGLYSFIKTDEIEFSDLNPIMIIQPSCGVSLPSSYHSEELDKRLFNNYLGDFTGNGKVDVFNSKTRRVYSFNPNKEENHVKMIKDGFENLIEFEYRVLPNQYTNLGYTSGEFGNDYKIVNFPITVASRIINENAFYEGTIFEKNLIARYSYRGSLFYKPKRSWVGYKKNIISSGFRSDQFSWDFPIVSETIYEPQYDGLLMPTYSKTEITNELISDAEFEYEILNPNSSNSQIIFPYQNQIIEKQYTGPSFVTSTTINNFNNNGNLDYSKTTNENSVDNNKIIVETDYVYVGAGDITTPHKPELTTTKTSYQNSDETTPEEDFETEMFYEYYSNGNLKKQTDNKTLIFTHYEDYNHYGLPQNITTNVPGKTARTKNFVYSQCGRFVLKETDDMDFSVEYKYHTRTNNLISTTDAFGHTTKYKYDNLNRLIETADPLGRKTSKTYEWFLKFKF